MSKVGQRVSHCTGVSTQLRPSVLLCVTAASGDFTGFRVLLQYHQSLLIIRMLTHVFTYAHKHPDVCIHTFTHSCGPALIYTHSCTYTYSPSHTHTHTHASAGICFLYSLIL